MIAAIGSDNHHETKARSSVLGRFFLRDRGSNLGIGAVWAAEKITKHHAEGLRRLARSHYQNGDAA